jgi:phosphonate transport system substrate-binding protein
MLRSATITRLLGILSLACYAGASLAADQDQTSAQPLTFGIVPQQSATTLARLWAPIMAHLAAQSGQTIQFGTAPDIPEFERRLAAGAYDLAYMNPYHYTVFSRVPGYRAVAKEQDRRIQGLLVVRVDSPYQRPEELANETLVFPAPAAFAASVLPRAGLTQQGIPFTTKYLTSHDSVYLAVARGLFPAGGGIARTFETLPPETRDQLRVLWTTETFTPHAFAVHPRVSSEQLQPVLDAMFAMGQDSRGAALLEAIGFKGIEPATDSDWDDIRALEIDALDTEDASTSSKP